MVCRRNKYHQIKLDVNQILDVWKLKNQESTYWQPTKVLECSKYIPLTEPITPINSPSHSTFYQNPKLDTLSKEVFELLSECDGHTW